MRRASAESGERDRARALQRLNAPGAVLARDPHRTGFGVFPRGDRRRRPTVRLSAEQVAALAAEGAIAPSAEGDIYTLTQAGASAAMRLAARPSEAFLAQHAPIIDRIVIDKDGDLRAARGYSPFGAIDRLAKLRNADGAPWLAPEEMSAAKRLRADWDAGQTGLVRGADWAAPPQSRNARGPGNGRETSLAIGIDARARVDAALKSLAPPLRSVVDALLLRDCGLEEFERAQHWPPRSAKIALKLALAQLARPPR